MATIDSYRIIKTMVDSDGHYPGDPQALSIWEYTNAWGKTAWCVHWDRASEVRMLQSPAINDPHLLWSRESGINAQPTEVSDGQ